MMVRVSALSHLSLPGIDWDKKLPVLKLGKSWANGDELVTPVTTCVCMQTFCKTNPILHAQTQKCQDSEQFRDLEIERFQKMGTKNHGAGEQQLAVLGGIQTWQREKGDKGEMPPS